MLPNKTDLKWKFLLSGEINHQFKSVPAGMLVTRLRRQLLKDNSNENMSKCIDEAIIFFKKYETLFIEDIKKIFG